MKNKATVSKKSVASKVTTAKLDKNSLYLSELSYEPFRMWIEKHLLLNGLCGKHDVNTQIRTTLGLTAREFKAGFAKWSDKSLTNADYIFQLFYFIGRGHEGVTIKDQTKLSHIKRGVRKFFHKVALNNLRHSSIKQGYREIIYIEADYSKLLGYDKIPDHIFKAWSVVAKMYGYTASKKGTKVYFK